MRMRRNEQTWMVTAPAVHSSPFTTALQTRVATTLPFPLETTKIANRPTSPLFGYRFKSNNTLKGFGILKQTINYIVIKKIIN